MLLELRSSLLMSRGGDRPGFLESLAGERRCDCDFELRSRFEYGDFLGIEDLIGDLRDDLNGLLERLLLRL